MVFSRICVNNNVDSPSFVDDSEEKMEATKRIARCYSQGLMSIFGSASIGIAVIVDRMTFPPVMFSVED
ncbi:Uroporphyrinogen decarboxylase [Trichinella pseudospiralis]